MKLICLVENTEGSLGCIAEHGLSLYAETEKHKILLDFGQTDAMIKNAEKLGIDLKTVDNAFLSHGHYDHSGSLLEFAELNPDAHIFMQRKALEKHYHGERYIGIDKKTADLPDVKLLDGDFKIDDELEVFTGITGRRLYPQGNLELETERDGIRETDDFSHEQCLVITDGDKKYLLSGCSHNGILNILDRYISLYGKEPYAVVTGFHMMKKTEYTAEEINIIKETAIELTKYDTIFVSGHCTSLPAFEIMKEIMGDRLIAMHSGEIIF